GDLDPRVADLVHVTDAGRRLVQPAHGHVLPEAARRDVASLPFRPPAGIVLGRIKEERALRTAVDFAGDLHVTGEAFLAEPHAPVDRLLPDRAGPRAVHGVGGAFDPDRACLSSLNRLDSHPEKIIEAFP